MIATPSNGGANLIAQLLIQSGQFADKENEIVRLFSFNSLTKEKFPDCLDPYSATIDTGECQRFNEADFELDFKTKRKLTIETLEEYRIVISTCNLLGCIQLEMPTKFSHVVIDEAGQCTEPEALIPLTFVHRTNGQIILAGDSLQMGPVVYSRSAKIRKLDESLLARMLERDLYKEDLKVRGTTLNEIKVRFYVKWLK